MGLSASIPIIDYRQHTISITEDVQQLRLEMVCSTLPEKDQLTLREQMRIRAQVVLFTRLAIDNLNPNKLLDCFSPEELAMINSKKRFVKALIERTAVFAEAIKMPNNRYRQQIIDRAYNNFSGTPLSVQDSIVNAIYTEYKQAIFD